MSKKGFIKIKFISVQGLKCKEQACEIKTCAIDTNISTKISEKDIENQEEFYLPITEKIQIELHSSLPNIGFFELPIKKIFEYPTKKHIITVNCITKDPHTNEINPQVYAILKVSLMFFQNHIAKLDILIDKVQLIQEKKEGDGEKEVYVECIVGNVASQTTLKKVHEGSWFEWKQMLPFTLESIPGVINILIRDKDMTNEDALGRISLDPQKERMFQIENNKEQRTYEIIAQGRTIEVYLSKLFKIPDNQQ